jgi:hypothetical protein
MAGEYLRALMRERNFTRKDEDAVFNRIVEITDILHPFNPIAHDKLEFDGLTHHYVNFYMRQLIARKSVLYILREDDSIHDSDTLFDKMREAPPPDLRNLVEKRLTAIDNSFLRFFYPQIAKVQHAFGLVSNIDKIREIANVPHL